MMSFIFASHTSLLSCNVMQFFLLLVLFIFNFFDSYDCPSLLIYSEKSFFSLQPERFNGNHLYTSVITFLMLYFQANEDVLQVVEILQTQLQKWNWLLSHIVEFCSGETFCVILLSR